jgi:ABC-type dipeptide/oligopeptide/nickel transport system permease component
MIALLRRLLSLVPVLVGASIVTFVLSHIVPGTPFDGDKITPEVRANLLKQYGLDRPLPEQYLRYLGHLLRGDLGVSVKITNESVGHIIAQRFPVSLQLGLAASVIIVVLGLSIGTLGALRHNTWMDYVSLVGALAGYSLPVFVLGLLLILLLSNYFHLLPVGGWGQPQQVIIPAFALAIGPASMVARLTRASMLEVINQDYIRTAKTKGLPKRTILARHAVRNGLLPVVTVLGAQISWLITGSFIVEYMFAIPGLGQMFVESAAGLDYPLIMGLTLFYAVVIASMNIVVDASYIFLDPRLKFG